MTIEWKDSYLTGHKELDSDHQKLLLLLSTIKRQIDSDAPFASLKESIDLLAKVTQEHFQRESEVMSKLEGDTPLVKEHNQEHKALFDEVGTLFEELKLAILEKDKKIKCTEIFDKFEKWFAIGLRDDLRIKKLLNSPAK